MLNSGLETHIIVFFQETRENFSHKGEIETLFPEHQRLSFIVHMGSSVPSSMKLPPFLDIGYECIFGSYPVKFLAAYAQYNIIANIYLKPALHKFPA
jgi:hypothetical protein